MKKNLLAIAVVALTLQVVNQHLLVLTVILRLLNIQPKVLLP